MAKELLLGVKLCGSCNPEIETMGLACRVAAALGGRVVPYAEGTITLTISACPSACVEERYPSPAVVRGLRLNGRLYPNEDALARATVALLQMQIPDPASEKL